MIEYEVGVDDSLTIKWVMMRGGLGCALKVQNIIGILAITIILIKCSIANVLPGLTVNNVLNKFKSYVVSLDFLTN